MASKEALFRSVAGAKDRVLLSSVLALFKLRDFKGSATGALLVWPFKRRIGRWNWLHNGPESGHALNGPFVAPSVAPNRHCKWR
jgi:hypothetical protein